MGVDNGSGSNVGGVMVRVRHEVGVIRSTLKSLLNI